MEEAFHASILTFRLSILFVEPVADSERYPFSTKRLPQDHVLRI